MNCFKRHFLLLLPVMLIAVPGCGGGSRLPDGVESGTVSGMITSDGSTLPEGCVVSFLPSGDTLLPASGVVASDGTFELTTRDLFEIPTGVYKVIMSPPPLPPLTEEEETKAMLEGTTQPNQIDQIPTNYMSATTTPLTYEIEVGVNDVMLDMTE